MHECRHFGNWGTCVLFRPRLQLQLNDVTSRSTWVNQNTEWRWLGGQSCQVPLWSWCLHQDELLVVLVVQGVADWKGHLIICGVGCRWMSPAILGGCWSGNTSSRSADMSVMCWRCVFSGLVFDPGFLGVERNQTCCRWLRPFAGNFSSQGCLFSVQPSHEPIQKTLVRPVQQRSVNVNLIENWNLKPFSFPVDFGRFSPDLFIASLAKSHLRNPSECMYLEACWTRSRSQQQSLLKLKTSPTSHSPYPNLKSPGNLITRSLYSWCFKAAHVYRWLKHDSRAAHQEVDSILGNGDKNLRT